MFPILFETDLFGLFSEPWALHAYGVLIVIGFVIALVLGQHRAREEQEDPDQVVDLAFWLLLAGLVGARIVFVITKWREYLASPLNILWFWKGGVVWYGGFIAAALFGLWYCRRYRLPYLKYADMIIPLVALGHAFGRLGCFTAGCCYGQPTDLSWGVVFPTGSAIHADHQSSGLVAFGESPLPIHPTQLYEAGFELTMFWVLSALRPYKRFHGQLLLIWLAAYPIARSLIEMVRGDKERGIWFWGLSTSQILSIAVAGAAVWLYLYLRRRRTRPLPAVAT